MKIRSVFLLVAFCLLFSSPSYADFDSTDGLIQLFLIMLFIILICGIALGFLIKWLLFKLGVTVSNWLIFVSAVILAGILLIMRNFP